MKITILTKIFNFVLLSLYIILITLLNLNKVWFSLALILISIPILIKSMYYVLDSKLWFGSFLLLCGVFGVFKTFYGLEFTFIYPIYILIFGLSSFLVFAIFRQNIHLKVFVICFFEVVLLSIYKFAYISLTEFCFIQAAFLIFVLTNMLVRAKINTRSN